ncbi:MAG: FecR domain-containing protein [Roseobacter sp.]
MRDFMKRSCSGGLVAALLFSAVAAVAQDSDNCVSVQASDQPARQIFTCGDALSFEREPTAALKIVKQRNDPAPRTIEVENGAIFIAVTPGSKSTRIRTPHAIATVRGTTYVVDAQTDQTSVFVIEGEVAVRRPNSTSTVVLKAGEGVDARQNAPLIVEEWGAERKAALLARFGR